MSESDDKNEKILIAVSKLNEALNVINHETVIFAQEMIITSHLLHSILAYFAKVAPEDFKHIGRTAFAQAQICDHQHAAQRIASIFLLSDGETSSLRH